MRKRIAAVICIVAIAALSGAAYYLLHHYHVERVYVSGNTQYSDEEIKAYVMNGPLSDNSLYLSWRYRNRSAPEIPFVEKLDVEALDPQTVRIRVYEKALAGYIDYVGQYVYFSRDGIVVEVSKNRIAGIPEVRGLSFDQIVLYEELKTENSAIFEQILNTTQLLGKYNLSADKIYFDKNYNMTLFFGNVRVVIGQNAYIDEKIANLQFIIPHLEGRSGTIDMTDYTPETVYTTFKESPAMTGEKNEEGGQTQD